MTSFVSWLARGARPRCCSPGARGEAPVSRGLAARVADAHRRTRWRVPVGQVRLAWGRSSAPVSPGRRNDVPRPRTRRGRLVRRGVRPGREHGGGGAGARGRRAPGDGRGAFAARRLRGSPTATCARRCACTGAYRPPDSVVAPGRGLGGPPCARGRRGRRSARGGGAAARARGPAGAAGMAARRRARCRWWESRSTTRAAARPCARGSRNGRRA